MMAEIFHIMVAYYRQLEETFLLLGEKNGGRPVSKERRCKWTGRLLFSENGVGGGFGR